MARRRKVATPSAEDLAKIEEGFRSETSLRPNGALAPISQIAADAARAGESGTAEVRAEQAKNATDAERLREAEEQGRVLVEIPIEDINQHEMVRDRLTLDPEEQEELVASISKVGLRLPIEVYKRENIAEGEPPYGLISGFRRLAAFKQLVGRGGSKNEKFKKIIAIVRDVNMAGGTFAAMVEENEIRASLSHYERGRIAAIAAQEGLYPDTDAAINGLYHAASKSKRSKIRSFASIHEELGDLLRFPENLSERQGLRLATALRNDGGMPLRMVLLSNDIQEPAQEWPLLEPVIAEHEDHADPKRGGRPKANKPKTKYVMNAQQMADGTKLQAAMEGSAWVIKLSGQRMSPDEMEQFLADIVEMSHKYVD